MIYLKKASLRDAKKEYILAQKIPAKENDYENEAFGVTYEEYIEKIIPNWTDREQGKELPNNYVPDTHYFLWDDDVPVGLFSLRHCLSDWLRDNAGHIGYGIAKEYRGKGYATEGLRLVIEEARKLPIDTDEIYMSVLKNNPASLKVMQRNGAKIVGEDKNHYYTRIPL